MKPHSSLSATIQLLNASKNEDALVRLGSFEEVGGPRRARGVHERRHDDKPLLCAPCKVKEGILGIGVCRKGLTGDTYYEMHDLKSVLALI